MVVVAALAYGTFLVQLLLLTGTAYFAAKKLGYSTGFMERFRDLVSRYYLELAFLQALVATAGSLYMSNFLGWEPCRLCWFQRIAIYPLVVLTAAGLVLEKKDVRDYVIPLALLGIPVSIYHYAVQRITQFQAAGCSVTAVSCSTEYTFYLGYITVPMMALTALVAVLVLVWRFSSPRER